ncbi:hypothetical protein SAMN04489806_0143 [Paramicrobacterium humi]|uniref:DUF4287 domain-containing protein n=1 Tax=Paramicrobacterium humi TaxID=640635 RepID=A0A1H4IQ52_9MICO|nr:hypothetical protein [Microbacterium humi]SEB36189.1 hypothetical protein SAMN04489806_0143 [Microbacterium humi]
MSGATSDSRRTAGDDAVRAATGRGRDEWHAILDEAGARAWDHPTIAAYLVAEHGVGDWWAQGVTVGFEQHIGRRLPGQRADGSFEGSVSRGLGVGTADGLDALLDAVRSATGCEAASVNPTAKNPSVRWKLPDGRTLQGMVSPLGEDRCRVVLTMAKLASADELEQAKRQMKQWLPGS